MLFVSNCISSSLTQTKSAVIEWLMWYTQSSIDVLFISIVLTLEGNWNWGQIRLFLKLLLSHLISIEWNWNWLEIDLKLRANKTLAQIAIYSFNIEWMKLKLNWNRGQIRLLQKLLLSHLISILSAKVARVENTLWNMKGFLSRHQVM